MKARKKSNIIVVQEVELAKEVNGIALPYTTSLTCSQVVKVIEKGDGISDDEKLAMKTIEPGSYLLVEKGAGQIVMVDEQKYLFIDIGQIFGIIK